jgi:hypothetical protein
MKELNHVKTQTQLCLVNKKKYKKRLKNVQNLKTRLRNSDRG